MDSIDSVEYKYVHTIDAGRHDVARNLSCKVCINKIIFDILLINLLLAVAVSYGYSMIFTMTEFINV